MSLLSARQHFCDWRRKNIHTERAVLFFIWHTPQFNTGTQKLTVVGKRGWSAPRWKPLVHHTVYIHRTSVFPLSKMISRARVNVFDYTLGLLPAWSRKWMSELGTWDWNNKWKISISNVMSSAKGFFRASYSFYLLSIILKSRKQKPPSERNACIPWPSDRANRASANQKVCWECCPACQKLSHISCLWRKWKKTLGCTRCEDDGAFPGKFSRYDRSRFRTNVRKSWIVLPSSSLKWSLPLSNLSRGSAMCEKITEQLFLVRLCTVRLI